MEPQVKEPVAFATDQAKKTNPTKELERELIKSLAGNYGVSFRFAETFAPDTNYEYYDRKFANAKEVAIVIEETEDKISIQHLLYVGKDKIIKHWRQDWIYENRELFSLVEGHEWKKRILSKKEVEGTWTQKVYQVDDCLRYQGYGTWVHVDGRHFWESTADAALPRREINIRNDYNILKRHSHIELFEDGSWVIDQDNEKTIRSVETNEDILLCMEKGIEKFTPKNYDPSYAKQWWEDHKEFWTDVRQIWTEIMANQDHIKVSEDEKLYMAQFDLAEQFAGENYDSDKAGTAIRELLAKHVQ